MRPPDFTIGVNYLHRWHLIPRNRWFNVYLHKICASDDDRALHDHPWWNLSIILRGSYFEVTPDRTALRRAGSLILRRPTDLHRLVVHGGTVWTLFITGPRTRVWGFRCPQGWRPWYEFVDPQNRGMPGKGCE